MPRNPCAPCASRVRRSRVGTASLALLALLGSGCFALAGPQRVAGMQTLLAESVVPVVVEPDAHLAFVSVAEALTFRPGFTEGESLRAEFDLAAPAPGFAEALVAVLHADARFASTRFEIQDLDAAREALLARGAEPVLFATAGGSWRLYYDLTLRRYRMSVWFRVQALPASLVANGQGAMALPERLWKADCTFRGPERPRPIAVWRAEEGALLHQTIAESQQACARYVAQRLADFIERGEEQGAFDTGDIEAPR